MSVFGTPNYRTFLGSRGIIAGSGPQGPGLIDTIQSIQMSVFAADAVDFGELTIARYGEGGSTGTRVLMPGVGSSPPDAGRIDYINVVTPGDGVDFGELGSRGGQSESGRYATAPDGVRCAMAGGGGPTANIQTIDYFNMNTIGGGAVNFGLLNQGPNAEWDGKAGGSDGYRGSAGGGNPPQTTINVFNIGVPGDAEDFGELAQGNIFYGSEAATDGSRLVQCSGYAGGATKFDTIHYYNISNHRGTAMDFGEMFATRASSGVLSDGSLALHCGGNGGTETVGFFRIGFPGNSLDYAELAADSASQCTQSGG